MKARLKEWRRKTSEKERCLRASLGRDHDRALAEQDCALREEHERGLCAMQARLREEHENRLAEAVLAHERQVAALQEQREESMVALTRDVNRKAEIKVRSLQDRQSTATQKMMQREQVLTAEKFAL